MEIFVAVQQWWNSLSQGTTDNILGGLIVAFITGIVASFRLWFFRANKSQSKDREVNAKTGRVPIPPRQLRNYVQRFDDNKKNILKIVSGQLDQNQMVVLWGSGGIGKTTIATAVAHKLLSKLPHGIVWIGVDGISKFDLARLQDEICGQLGWIQDVSPYFLESKAALSRMLLSRRRCLLVIDSFEIIELPQQDPILTFLDDMPIPVLITSRKRLTKGEHIHIGPMKDTEARKFLKNLMKDSYRGKLLAKNDPDRIIHTSENNPLYIKWMVRQLETGLDANSILLGTTLKGDAGERIFERSHKLLDDNAKKVLLCLTLFPSSVSKNALQKVASLDPELLDQALWHLTQLDLIVMEDGRPIAQNLIRRLSPSSKDFESEFFAHLVEYYIRVANQSNYYQNATSLDTEYENIMGTLNWLFRHKEWHKALQLFDATGEFVTDRSGYEGRLYLGNLVLTAAKQANDERAYAWHSVYTLGWVYLREGNLDQAIPEIEASLTWAKQHDSKDVLALCLRSLGLVERRNKNLSAAKKYITESLEIWQELNDRRWTAMSLAYLAEIAVEENDFHEALNFAEQSRSTFSELGNEEGLAWITAVLGNIMSRSGSFNQARDYYLESLRHRELMRAPSGMAHTQIALATVEMNLGNYAKAYDYVQTAIDLYKQLGTMRWLEQAKGLRKEIRQQIKHHWTRNIPFYLKLTLRKLSFRRMTTIQKGQI